MKIIVILLISVIAINASHAQIFIDKANIEFEVKSNIKKNMGNNIFDEMMKDKLPTFKTGYYNYTFADNKSIYKFSKWNEAEKIPEYLKKDDEEYVYFTDFKTGTTSTSKTKFGSKFNLEDSILKLDWQITSESRTIAGFNCRKAVTKIFDSVYVFAFYTDEIMISGGPASINGLPGMILGVTIPRLFTSWIATRVSVNGIVPSEIKPITAKKVYNNEFLKNTITEKTKDWWGGDDSEENRQQKNRFLWSILL